MARLTREQSQALTREKLLQSAGDVVARYSYDGVSVERIAEEAGFSKGAFYSNFSSKEDILQHLLEGNAGRDVQELTRLLENLEDPHEVIEAVARWSDARAAEQKWGIIAIEMLRRAQRDGTLTSRQRQLFSSQWEEVGELLRSKLFPPGDILAGEITGDDVEISAVGLGGIVLELTYGGIAVFLKVNTAGQMVREVLTALRRSVRVAHSE
ncbi:TetR/AcrR family transcriptional regulator [Arthrobacter sp. SA17]